MTVVWILLAWFAVSVIVGLLAARMIAAANHAGDLAEFLANPKDDDQ